MKNFISLLFMFAVGAGIMSARPVATQNDDKTDDPVEVKVVVGGDTVSLIIPRRNDKVTVAQETPVFEAPTVKKPVEPDWAKSFPDGSSATGAKVVSLNRITRKNEEHRRLLIEEIDEKVIIDGDTVSMILPERNFGRYDRGLFNYMFIPKGRWAFGLTASYGELNTDDIQVLSILKDFDFGGKIYSINPTISYFIRHNQSVGLKFTYSKGVADLNNLSVDFDDDMNFSIRDVSYVNETFATAFFYRNYIGLGMSKRFGVFNEVDLSFQSGNSRFKRIYNSEPKDTRTNIVQAALNFSPGVAVFIQDYVAFNVSFGIFGLKWRKEHQVTDGVDEGTRFASGANFRFNIFNINFGLMVVI